MPHIADRVGASRSCTCLDDVLCRRSWPEEFACIFAQAFGRQAGVIFLIFGMPHHKTRKQTTSTVYGPYGDDVREDLPLATVSFDPKFFKAAAELLRGERVDDDDESISRLSRNDMLHWLDSMSQHCRGDMRHLLEGDVCV